MNLRCQTCGTTYEFSRLAADLIYRSLCICELNKSCDKCKKRNKKPVTHVLLNTNLEPKLFLCNTHGPINHFKRPEEKIYYVTWPIGEKEPVLPEIAKCVDCHTVHYTRERRTAPNIVGTQMMSLCPKCCSLGFKGVKV
jgi:hypothetical protein